MPFFIPDIKFKIVKKHAKQEILSIFCKPSSFNAPFLSLSDSDRFFGADTGDFGGGQFESFACRESGRAGRFRFAEHFGVVSGIPERRAAVFGEHFDKKLFRPCRFRKVRRPNIKRSLCRFIDVVSFRFGLDAERPMPRRFDFAVFRPFGNLPFQQRFPLRLRFRPVDANLPFVAITRPHIQAERLADFDLMLPHHHQFFFAEAQTFPSVRFAKQNVPVNGGLMNVGTINVFESPFGERFQILLHKAFSLFRRHSSRLRKGHDDVRHLPAVLPVGLRHFGKLPFKVFRFKTPSFLVV